MPVTYRRGVGNRNRRRGESMNDIKDIKGKVISEMESISVKMASQM